MNRISIALCALLFAALPLTSMAHISRQARKSSATTHITKKADKKESTATTKKTQKTAKKAANKNTTKSKTASSAKESSITTSKDARTRSKHTVNKTASVNFTEKYTKRKSYKPRCVEIRNVASGTFADAHKTKVQKATKVAINKLIQQVGRSCRWSGNSPRIGFDYSSLVYYAHKDLVKIRIPRTTNEMYYLRDAAPIERSGLKNGDLVFFRIRGRGTADHVGAYVGSDKFIQSPRTGRGIQVTPLSEDYWQRHYVGARRVMAPKTLH